MTDTFARLARPGARRARVTLAGTAVALLVAAAGCTSGSDPTPASPPIAVAVTGSLCDQLPAGDEPGNPNSLVGQPADQALQWIPVLTTFEAAVRATGLASELTGSPGVTILAPTDDAFTAKFSRTNLDELLLQDTDKLRELLRDHVVTGPMPVAELVDAGSATTLAGTRLTVTGQDQGARIADRADTVCADYQAANARIHVINQVLGSLPTTAGTEDDHDHTIH
ncbi:fasciclin domain-containing protein [Micromonospora zingiberis]|uniref:fasciclin domain-containing protein n=1 Tax=Micromonospora zingiberis TaxID=2053011 RepID=UPI0013F4771D|nr:fasciclin domain-containing protein [Micromonospora zingiberis]